MCLNGLNAGVDNLAACQTEYETSANAPTVGLGEWSIASFIPIGGGAPTATITTIDSPNNPVTTLSSCF